MVQIQQGHVFSLLGVVLGMSDTAPTSPAPSFPPTRQVETTGLPRVGPVPCDKSSRPASCPSRPSTDESVVP